MRSLIIGIIIVAVLALGTFVFIQGNNNGKKDSTSTSNDTSSELNNSTEEKAITAEEEVTITYTDTGFSPDSVVVKSGGKINWVNNSSGQLQLGADPHPSHTGNKEITGNQFVLTLEKGEKETVIVEKKGVFGYHNHLISGDSGSVKVE